MSTRIRSLKFNAVMNMILVSSSFIFPLITVPYVSRVLNPSGMGAVAFAQSIVSYFSLAALLGISTYGVRACAQVRGDPEELSRTVEELLVILAASTTLTFAAYLLALQFVPRLAGDKPLFLIFGTALWLASFGVEWFYQAIEQYGYITIRSIAVKLIGLILMFAFVHQASDYHVYGMIVVFTGYGANILNMLRLRAFIRFTPLNQLNITRHFKPMASFLVSSVSSGMYAQADMVLLGFLATNHVVGIYQLVAKIKTMLVMAINSVVNVMLPRLSYYARNSREKYHDLLVKNIDFVLLFASAGIACAALCADAIIDILGGSQYRSAALPLLCILPALLFVSLNTVLSQYLISSGHERQYAIVNFTGLVSSILYCLILIPPFGATGAALSCSLCELTALLIRCWYARDFITTIRKDLQIIPAPIAAATATGIILLIRIAWWPTRPLPQIIATGTVFTILYTAMLLLLKERTTISIMRKITYKHY
ncbi:flippase [Bifidobacterium felsineum]|uniref:Polysaccharide biosynthesis protein n=1 Tax=Bifidobacterium felsineum TaxID=2045440 RepID=A0A2M9HIJ7_9BIFI|nr:flippase [Bifidobacterium felsineum]PJM76619.1 polysaccharide biosynthesis protein [Bifidobacterium felsineum]